MEQTRQQQISVELRDEEAEGIYSNMVMIANSPTEIIMDFARVMPRKTKARVLSRIIMTPMHAKLLRKALDDNLSKFEKQFGEIKLYGFQNQESKPIGFGPSSDDKGNDA